MQNYKPLRKNIGENSIWDLGLGKEFLRGTPKAQFIKGNMINQTIKILNFCFVEDLVKRIKEKLQIRRTYLQTTYLTKN